MDGLESLASLSEKYRASLEDVRQLADVSLPQNQGKKVAIRREDAVSSQEGRIYLSGGRLVEKGNPLYRNYKWIKQVFCRNWEQYVSGDEASAVATVRYFEKVEAATGSFLSDVEEIVNKGAEKDHWSQVFEELGEVETALAESARGIRSLSATYRLGSDASVADSLADKSRRCIRLKNYCEQIRIKLSALSALTDFYQQFGKGTRYDLDLAGFMEIITEEQLFAPGGEEVSLSIPRDILARFDSYIYLQKGGAKIKDRHDYGVEEFIENRLFPFLSPSLRQLDDYPRVVELLLKAACIDGCVEINQLMNRPEEGLFFRFLDQSEKNSFTFSVERGILRIEARCPYQIRSVGLEALGEAQYPLYSVGTLITEINLQDPELPVKRWVEGADFHHSEAEL